MTRRIVYVTSQFPFGNREAFLAAEVREVMKLVDAVDVVAMRPKTRSSGVAGIEAHGLRSWSVGTWARAVRALMRWPSAARTVLGEMCCARYRPMAKVKNIAVFFKGLALADFCRVRGADVLHAHWLTTPSTAAVIAGRLTGIPVGISVHRFDLYADNWVAGKVAAARFVRVISKRAANELQARTPQGLWERIRVVHLGVELRAPSRGTFRDDGCLRILAIGFLTPVKGHRDLIAAAALLRAMGVLVQCDIVGDGPLNATLHEQIARFDLAGTVVLRGFVPHEQLMSEIGSGAFDVLAHPSIEDGTEHEGIPVALMEAMSFALPCVATDTGSIGELIDSTCGMLVQQHDAAGLARALRALAEDAGLRRKMGCAARERVLTNFDASQAAGELVNLMFAQ